MITEIICFKENERAFSFTFSFKKQCELSNENSDFIEATWVREGEGAGIQGCKQDGWGRQGGSGP